MHSSELHWAQIRVGLFVALGLFVAFAAAAALGLAGSPLNRRIHLHGEFDDVSGLAVGSPIEMGGVVVGELAEVKLPDLATGKIPVELAIEPKALDRLGPSSTAFVGSHALVGQRFIGLTPRRPDEQPLTGGGEIKTSTSASAEAMLDDAREALTELREMLADVRIATGAIARAGEALDKGQGTLGRLVHDPELYDRLLAAAKRTDELTDGVSKGGGVLGVLLADPTVAQQVKDSVGALSRAAARVDQGEGVLGQLTKNGDASKRMEKSLANVELVTTRLVEARGTLGALISDPALLGRMNALLVQMDQLVADVRRNPQRYLKLGL